MAEEQKAEYNVAKVNISASVAGKILSVQGATIEVGLNSIPTVELHCAPSERPSYSNKVAVIKPSISDFKALYDDLSEAANTLNETGGVTIRVTVEGDRPRKETISLNGWILAGVGMSNVSATSAPHLSVVLQHPICQLTKVGSVYLTPKTDTNAKINQAIGNEDNFLQVIDNLYNLLKDPNLYLKPLNDKATAWVTALGNSKFKPSKYLAFNGSGIFLAGGPGDSMKRRLAQAMARYALPYNKDMSTWDMIVQSSGELLLHIVQDEGHNYTKEQLLWEPARPWKKATLNLNEEDCFWTELPGPNPYRIAGVMTRGIGKAVDGINQGLASKKNGNIENPDTEPCGEVMYAPGSVDPETAPGRVMKVSCPYCLDAAFRMDAESRSPDIISARVDGKDPRALCFQDMLNKYCQQVYEMSEHSMVRAKAQMALFFKDSGGKNLLLPGNTCTFTTRDAGILYYGYITGVLHHISTEGGCGTTVSMNYVRPGPGLGDLIAEDAPNLVYQ